MLFIYRLKSSINIILHWRKRFVRSFVISQKHRLQLVGQRSWLQRPLFLLYHISNNLINVRSFVMVLERKTQHLPFFFATYFIFRYIVGNEAIRVKICSPRTGFFGKIICCCFPADYLLVFMVGWILW